jgi:putative ABC transport system ATP-binding protein
MIAKAHSPRLDCKLDQRHPSRWPLTRCVVLPDADSAAGPDERADGRAQAVRMFSTRHFRRPATRVDPGAPAIEARGIVKVFGDGEGAVRALDGVDLVVRQGEMVAIMGPSGSGKSTLLHIVGALESPTEGTVAVAGERYDGLDDEGLTRLRRDRIGFIFQFFNLLSTLTAEENVLLPALIARRADAATRARARALLELVGLGERATHTPAELSGGQQQRVSIARALLMEPRLVLADEPTGNLDTRSGREVLRVLRELNRAEGRTILMVTHDPAAAAAADRVLFLRDGRYAGEVAGGSTPRVIELMTTLESQDEAAQRDPAPAMA